MKRSGQLISWLEKLMRVGGFYPWTEEALKSAVRNKVIDWERQSGKTTYLIAEFILAHMYGVSPIFLVPTRAMRRDVADKLKCLYLEEDLLRELLEELSTEPRACKGRRCDLLLVDEYDHFFDKDKEWIRNVSTPRKIVVGEMAVTAFDTTFTSGCELEVFKYPPYWNNDIEKRLDRLERYVYGRKE